jgi:hypothetical protein
LNPEIDGRMNKVKFTVLLVIGLAFGLQNLSAQIEKESVQADDSLKMSPVISRLQTLSIHVRDTITHDSVFHFLADKLQLPVYFYPTRGKRKWAGVYAGNLVLEPCGPYSNIAYASNDFRAIFFGLTFEIYKSAKRASMVMSGRKIEHKITGEKSISLAENIMCGENITVNLMDASDKYIDRPKMDSLRNLMKKDGANDLGIEYVKFIQIGYRDIESLERWKDFICPSVLVNNKTWNGSDNLNYQFIKDSIREVKGITFKVRSLEKAKRCLTKNNLIGPVSDGKIELDKSKAFGLNISFIE